MSGLASKSEIEAKIDTTLNQGRDHKLYFTVDIQMVR